MGYKAYIFDLDGTLLDTLPDLVRLTNMVLEERGWPLRSREEILSYVGHGGRHLIGCAAPADTPDAVLDEAFERWQDLYPQYGHALTRPYDGIPEMLEQLKAGGARLGVLSNKFNAATQSVIDEHFPGVFDIVRGECEEFPRKPDPTGLLHMMDLMGVRADEAAYVGDSQGDIEVARRARVFPVGVTWGYRSVEALRAACPGAIVDSPSALLDF